MRMPSSAALFLALCGVVCGADPYYTGFHAQPLKNWLNDPNGPMYFNGKYHLFFQYNPDGWNWGNMHWYHLVSEDAIRWKHLPVALAPDQSYDCGGIFSGSATIVDGVPVLSYSVACGSCVVNAYPANVSDPDLVQWTKPKFNPVIVKPKEAGNNFRDPTTSWKGSDGVWRMVVGCDIGTCEFKSRDYMNWSYVGPLFEHAGMWECPDFFPVPGAANTYVLKASASGDWWATGTYEEVTDFTKPDRFIPHSDLIPAPTQQYDAGTFYASKAFYDPKRQQQVLFGWVNYHCDGTDWSGVQTFPRTITVDPHNATALLTYPVAEIDTLYIPGNSSSVQNLVLAANSQTILHFSGSQLDIVATVAIDPSQEFVDWGIAVLASSATAGAVTTVRRNAAKVLNNTDMPGGDYAINNTFSLIWNPEDCQKLCQQDSGKCRSWTFVGPGVQTQYSRCCLKNTIPAAVPHPGMVSGVIPAPGLQYSLNGHPFRVYEDETAITLRLLVDHSIVESFVQSGRAAVTQPYCATPQEIGTLVRVFNNGPQSVTLTQLVARAVATANVQPTADA